MRRAVRWASAALAAAGAIILIPLISDYAFLRSLGTPASADRPAPAVTLSRLETMQRHSWFSAYADVGLHRGLDAGARGQTGRVGFSAQVVRVHPLPDVAFRHAVLLAANGDYAEASRWWSRAVASYPAAAPGWRAAFAALGAAPERRGAAGISRPVTQQ